MRPVTKSGIAAVLILTVSAIPVRGQAASAMAGALEPTQIANFIQLIEHSVRFAKMVKQGVDMVKQGKEQVESFHKTLKQFDPSSLQALVGFVQNVDAALKGFQGITFGARSTLDEFKKSHPGYAMPADAKKAYQDLDQQTLSMATRAAEKMDVQLTGLKSNAEIAQKLQAKIKDADGEVKALQIACELLVQLNAQMTTLIATLATHAAQVATYEANETQRRIYQEQTRAALIGRHEPAGPSIDWSAESMKGFQ